MVEAIEAVCDVCGGCGFLFDVNDSGYSVAKECPECRLQRLARGACGIPEHYRGMTWENWRDRPELTAAVMTLRAWRGEPSTVLLCPDRRSNFGTGKTLAMCLLAREWRERGLLAYYLPVAKMIANEGALIDGSRLSTTATAGWASTFGGLLALDDLGNEHQDKSGWGTALVEQAIDARYATELPTIVVSNLPIERLAERYPRAASRLREGEVLSWEATDFRPRRSLRKLRAVDGYNGKSAAAGPS